MKTKKKTTKRKKANIKPRIPSYVKDAANSLGEHFSCEVEVQKEEEEWILIADFRGELPTKWKSIKVERKVI